MRASGPGGIRQQKVTIRQVAEAAGVSIATVSRVVNGHSDVSAETRVAVERVLRERGYQAAPRRPGMASATGLVGVTMPMVHPGYFAQILSGASEALYEHGLRAALWCNPPGSGLGTRPTAATGVPLLDASLWVKTPGQSDGQCDSAGGVRAWDYTAYTRPGWPATAAGQALFDPLWGVDDPAAGGWFPQDALQLAQDAKPALP